LSCCAPLTTEYLKGGLPFHLLTDLILGHFRGRLHVSGSSFTGSLDSTAVSILQRVDPTLSKPHSHRQTDDSFLCLRVRHRCLEVGLCNCKLLLGLSHFREDLVPCFSG